MKTQPDFGSVLRVVLTAIGSFLIGRTLFGHNIDYALWEQIAGVVIILASTFWGIVNKTAGIEKIQSALRQVFVVAGGLIVSAGYITGNQLETILALIPVVLPLIYSYTSRIKSRQLADNTINVQQLKK